MVVKREVLPRSSSYGWEEKDVQLVRRRWVIVLLRLLLLLRQLTNVRSIMEGKSSLEIKQMIEKRETAMRYEQRPSVWWWWWKQHQDDEEEES